MKTTLILGAKGMLGTELCKVFPDAIAWDMAELDITDKEAVTEKLTELSPGLIINAAAYTDVDGAEKNQELAFKVNADAVLHLAEAAEKVSAVMVHYSTDYVFDGRHLPGHDEQSQKNPLNVYGFSKAGGEDNLVKAMGQEGNYYLIRTAWLYGKYGKNFVTTMLALAKTTPLLKVVNDQFGCPTYAKDLAAATKELVESKKPFGIYHATNAGSCSWYEFARAIFALKGVKIELQPCSSSQFPRPAKRPSYGILLNTKLPPLRHWKEALKEFLGEVK